MDARYCDDTSIEFVNRLRNEKRKARNAERTSGRRVTRNAVNQFWMETYA